MRGSGLHGRATARDWLEQQQVAWLARCNPKASTVCRPHFPNPSSPVVHETKIGKQSKLTREEQRDQRPAPAPHPGDAVHTCAHQRHEKLQSRQQEPKFLVRREARHENRPRRQCQAAAQAAVRLLTM